ncbi:MAG: PilZ domain-containing protein [Candidatus Omnitrophota bacterium]
MSSDLLFRVIMIGQVIVGVLVVLLFTSGSSRKEKPGEDEEFRKKDYEFKSRLMGKEEELCEVIAQKTVIEKDLRREKELLEAKVKEQQARFNAREQELNKALELAGGNELERLERENLNLSQKLTEQEEALKKISAQNQSAQDSLKKAQEELSAERIKRETFLAEEKKKLVAKENEFKEELSRKTAAAEEALKQKSDSLINKEEFERVKEEGLLSARKIAEAEAEVRRVTIQNQAIKNELDKATEKLEAEKQKTTALLKEEKDKFSLILLAKEQELQEALTSKAATEEVFKKKSQEMADKSQLELLEKENQRLAQKISEVESEIKKHVARNQTIRVELSQTKEKLAAERQKAEALLAEEKERFDAALAGKEEKFQEEFRRKVAAAEEEIRNLKEKIIAAEKAEEAKKEAATPRPVEEIPPVLEPIEQASLEEEPSEQEKAEAHERMKQLLVSIGEKDKKIGEILFRKGLIEQATWERALKYWEQYGGTITQYLLAYGYIDELQLAQCLSEHFKIPYLPLSHMDISQEILRAIPVDIAEKYVMIPVEKVGDIITVVMGDPFDKKAIKSVQEITGCIIRPLVGIFSEIIAALENYYQVRPKGKKKFPFFVESRTYTGLERRSSVRIDAVLDIEFPSEGKYKHAKTRNVSRDGFCFDTDISLPIGSILPIKVHLPPQVSREPVEAVTQIMDVIPHENNLFEIRLKTNKISQKWMNAIIDYASGTRKER